MFETKFIEVCTVKTMMTYFQGNKSRAAKLLKIERSTLTNWMSDETKIVKVLRWPDSSIKSFELINK